MHLTLTYPVQPGGRFFTRGNVRGYCSGFNGKERDDEGMGGGGSTYDYGFRIYNPQIARFFSVDPLFRDYPMLTTYQFASNTPVQAIDLDGLELAFAQFGTRVTAPVIGEIFGVSGSTNIGIAVDIHGNGVIFWNVSLGAGAGIYGGAGFEVGLFPTMDAENFSGYSVNVGITLATTIIFGEPIGPEGGFNVSVSIPTTDDYGIDFEKAEDRDNFKVGGSISPGYAGLGAGFEGHADVSYTWTIKSFHVSDVGSGLYNEFCSLALRIGSNYGVDVDVDTFYQTFVKLYTEMLNTYKTDEECE